MSIQDHENRILRGVEDALTRVELPPRPPEVVEVMRKRADIHSKPEPAARPASPIERQVLAAGYKPDPTDYAQPQHRPDPATRALGPLPPYVTHQPGSSKAAQIASHAAVSEHEDYARIIEQMGQEYHAQATAVINKVIAFAQEIRDRGAELFHEIQTSSKIGSEIVVHTEAMRLNLKDRMNEPTMTETPPQTKTAKRGKLDRTQEQDDSIDYALARTEQD